MLRTSISGNRLVSTPLIGTRRLYNETEKLMLGFIQGGKIKSNSPERKRSNRHLISDFLMYTQKRADIVDIPSVFHLVISPAQGDITYGQGDITFTL